MESQVSIRLTRAELSIPLIGIIGAGKSTHAKAVVRLMPTFHRLSIDGILAEHHGICGVDYARSDYEKYQDEADAIFHETAEQLLSDGQKDIVLDRSFYARETRDMYKELVEKHGCRWVLLYLKVPKPVLWERIQARRQAGIDADSALEISKDLLDFYCEGFDVPQGEGEIVIEYFN